MKTYFFILFLFVLSSFQGIKAQEETTLLQVSDLVSEFDFESSPGKSVSFSTLKGKTVLITFFATWCGPCRKELPFIQSDIYNKYKNNPNFELLIFGREHNWEEVSKFRNDNKFSMPIYPDPERKIYSLFAGQYIPRNFLISPEGRILYHSIGFEEKDFKALKAMIEKQLRIKKQTN